MNTTEIIQLLKNADPSGNKEAFVYDETLDKCYAVLGGGQSQIDPNGVAIHISSEE